MSTRADFKVTLVFRGFPVSGDAFDNEGEVWLRSFASSVNSHALDSGMCSDWRESFRPDDTEAHDLERSPETTHVMNVLVRPTLTAQVAVNGGRSVEQAEAAIEAWVKNVLTWGKSQNDGQVDFEEQDVYDVEVSLDYSIPDGDDIPVALVLS